MGAGCDAGNAAGASCLCEETLVVITFFNTFFQCPRVSCQRSGWKRVSFLKPSLKFTGCEVKPGARALPGGFCILDPTALR